MRTIQNRIDQGFGHGDKRINFWSVGIAHFGFYYGGGIIEGSYNNQQKEADIFSADI